MSNSLTHSVLTRRGFLKTTGIAAGVAVSGAFLAACGGSSTPAAAPPAAAAPVSLEIDSGLTAAEFKYSTTALEAPAGSKITLKFNNKTDAAVAVGHNWVLVKPTTEDSVVNNGTAAGDAAGWVKADDPNILAHTKLIKGGESDTITFDAPAAGAYTYLCTFPGHYAGGMKGTLTIK
jgi:azurin